MFALWFFLFSVRFFFISVISRCVSIRPPRIKGPQPPMMDPYGCALPNPFLSSSNFSRGSASYLLAPFLRCCGGAYILPSLRQSPENMHTSMCTVQALAIGKGREGKGRGAKGMRFYLPFPTSPLLLSLPFPSLPFPALPRHPALSFPTLPYPSLPFPSLPFLSLPFPSLLFLSLP